MFHYVSKNPEIEFQSMQGMRKVMLVRMFVRKGLVLEFFGGAQAPSSIVTDQSDAAHEFTVRRLRQSLHQTTDMPLSLQRYMFFMLAHTSTMREKRHALSRGLLFLGSTASLDPSRFLCTHSGAWKVLAT